MTELPLTHPMLTDLNARVQLFPFNQITPKPLSTMNLNSSWYGNITLGIHLDNSTDQASRRSVIQSRIINWATAFGVSFGQARVLDLFSGPGCLWESLSVCGCASYLGVDINPLLVDFAKDRYQNCSNVSFVCVDVKEFHGLSESIDVIFLNYEAINSLLPEDWATVGKVVATVLKPDGYLIGDVRLRPPRSVGTDVTARAYINTPFFEQPNFCLDEFGYIVDRMYWGHRLTAKDASISGPVNILQNFLYLPANEELRMALKQYFGCTIIHEGRLLKGLETDVPECSDNLFFIAQRQFNYSEHSHDY